MGKTQPIVTRMGEDEKFLVVEDGKTYTVISNNISTVFHMPAYSIWEEKTNEEIDEESELGERLIGLCEESVTYCFRVVFSSGKGLVIAKNETDALQLLEKHTGHKLKNVESISAINPNEEQVILLNSRNQWKQTWSDEVWLTYGGPVLDTLEKQIEVFAKEAQLEREKAAMVLYESLLKRWKQDKEE